MGGGREFDRIRAVIASLGDAAGVLGDDCAVLPAGEGMLVLSTDTSVEGVHFRREWLSLEEIGWRATAAALSDLASEGAEVVGALAAVVVPPGAVDAEVAALMRGAGAAVQAVGGRMLGGDLSAGPVWTIGVTVLGRAARPVTRAGAEVGDRLWITGVLGGARAAFDALAAGELPLAEARERFARPLPRVAAGRWLAAAGARAMLDLSDGLGGDAPHLAAASRVALDISLDRVPVSPAAVAPALALGVEPQRYAAEGGEDYELLAAMPAAFGDADALRFERELGFTLTRVGVVARGHGVRFTLGGAAITLRGFDHFA